MSIGIDIEEELGCVGMKHLKNLPYIHWLNFKDLSFTLIAESALLEIYRSCHKKFPTSTGASSDTEEHLDDDKFDGVHLEKRRNLTIIRRALSELEIVGDIIEKEGPEKLINDWTAHEHNFQRLINNLDEFPDLIFCINPLNGSMHIWSIDSLDNLSSSKLSKLSLINQIPDVISMYDASSLGRCVYVYYEIDFILNKSQSRFSQHEVVLELVIPNSIKVITKHGDEGILNLWNVQLNAAAPFSPNNVSISNVAHIGRLCGHRSQLTEVRSHPLLPLILTSSNSSDNENGLIAWHVQPISPLDIASTGTSGAGGLVSLDKMNTRERNGFSLIAWFLDTRKTFSSDGPCNDGLFTAFDGNELNIYYVACAPNPIKEMLAYEDDLDNSLFDKCGRILKIGPVNDSKKCWSDAKLMFVVSERSIPKIDDAPEIYNANSWQNYIIIAEQLNNAHDQRTLFHCWKVDIGFYACNTDPIVERIWGNEHIDVPSSKGETQSLPVPRNCGKLVSITVSSHFINSAFLAVVPHPAFHCATAYKDGTIWLWTAMRSELSILEWRCFSAVDNCQVGPAIRVDGCPLAVKCAFAGRLAVAFMPSDSEQFGLPSTHWTIDMLLGIFECESSGGITWQMEDCIQIPDVHLARKISSASGPLPSTFNPLRRLSDQCPKVEFEKSRIKTRAYSDQWDRSTMGRV
ncbi:hypothetical protein ACOME3_009106 [Neoechinorhynchus agilis]